MDNKKNSEIEEILGRINGSSDSSRAREYEFSYRDENGGLVFEFSEPGAAPTENRTGERAPVKEKEPELHFPDTFTVDERYNTPAGTDITGSIRTPYVPRFTEVSENYRMIDDPRPRKVAEVVEVTHAERVDNVAETILPTSEDDGVDPTAEIDVDSESAVVVTSGRTAVDEDVSETLNIYKFGEPEAEPVQKERTVEDERADITRLFIKNGEEPVAEPVVETVTDYATPTAPKLRRVEDYRIPDPVDPKINVVDFASDGHSRDIDVDPEGVKDSLSESEGKKTLEFTNKKQRDSFKDRFLDTLMSMRIRIASAVIFGIVLLTLECAVAFDLLVRVLPGLALSPWSYAVFDIILVGCMTLLVLPELSSAVKHLLRGVLTPEIAVLLGLAADVGYTVAVLAVQPMKYPLFGFLYAISAFSLVAASYAKMRADFDSFKLVTKNDEKRILDNKLTRSLPAENMALDGLVEEYKSRTARIFRTSFVSDFFKNSAFSAESAKHTALILALSVISAVTVGAVAFFLPSGGSVPVISAFSALSLVLLLSYPAISILSHKVPYMLAQRAAISEDSSVIGEQACFDFADIDVIAFDDTEIFGPDDVNMKRFVLYGDQKDIDVTMQEMCSLFSVAGGPLNYIFTGALDARVNHTPAKNPVIEDDGISGEIRGHKISAGTEEYMRRHGVALTDISGAVPGGIDTTKLMYAAKDGELYAKFFIRYSFSEEFTQLLPTLKEQGIVPLIYTRDPNVSNELLTALTAGSDCMRVVKRHDPDFNEDKLYRSISAGVVTYGDKINAINVILLAKRFKRFSRLVSTLEIYAAAVGAGLAAALVLLGMWSVPVAVLGLWQISWCIFLRVYASGRFSTRRSDE